MQFRVNINQNYPNLRPCHCLDVFRIQVYFIADENLVFIDYGYHRQPIGDPVMGTILISTGEKRLSEGCIALYPSVLGQGSRFSVKKYGVK